MNKTQARLFCRGDKVMVTRPTLTPLYGIIQSGTEGLVVAQRYGTVTVAILVPGHGGEKGVPQYVEVASLDLQSI